MKTEILTAVIEAKAGNIDPFSNYFHEIRSRIAFHVVPIVNDKDVANDIVSATYIKAATKIQSFDPDSCHLNTWIITIAKRLAIDHYRKNKKNIKSINSEYFTEGEKKGLLGFKINSMEGYADMVNPFKNEIVESFDIKEILRNLVSELRDDSREMVEMRYWGGMEYHEIAERLEKPIGTVKGQVFRAKAQMKKKLQAMKIGANAIAI